MKHVKIFALMLAASLVLAACTPAPAPAPAPPAPTVADAPADPTPQPEPGAAEGPFDIPVIIKATDSDYWQILASGALRFADQNPDLVNVTILGPPSEIDIDQQVAILENTIATQPDAIVIASTSSVATVPAVEQAMGMGIPVVTLDNRLETDVFTSFLATNHYLASGLVADYMVATWADEGIDPSGQSVIVISSVAGTAVNTARTNGFINRMRELVPDINVLETQFANNDIQVALDIAVSTISANDDLIGIFGDNNHMGVGIALAIEELDRSDIITFAFDANVEQVNAIHAGFLNGIVVQDPFGMGYNGVDFAVRTIRGETVPFEVVVDTNLVTLDNINNADIQELLSYHLPN
ncbi:MAG: substrate-binding domain-containing protein [Defluviitaleaceae bacterium]|nr:substrate-binding domain-containing protein [Defluviitaleaceae bacterium]